MEKNSIYNNQNLVKTFNMGGVVVMPTDTLYGIVGRAEDESVVERIYKTRKRTPEKPCIVLIGDIGELQKFNIILSGGQQVEIEKYTDPTSFVIDCTDEKFKYLHRGTNTLAFRLPRQVGLQNLLKETGPLIAPSANIEGFPPAKNIEEAKKYFGNLVDMYIDGGVLEGRASKVVKLNQDGVSTVLRE